jgi:photosystem II stability/assembly factor-like uncharacterized protein
MARLIRPRLKDGWRVVGPGGGGAQFSPVVSPHDDRDMFILCDMSGFYRSRDAGESFLQMSWGNRAGEAVYHPADANVVYGCSTALYRSEDAGRRWRMLFPKPGDITERWREHRGDEADMQHRAPYWPGGHCATLAVDERDPGTMVLAAAHPTETREPRLALYVTHNGGGDFVPLSFQMPGTFWRHVRILYRDGKRQYWLFSDAGFVIYDESKDSASPLMLPPDTTGLVSASAGYTTSGGLLAYAYAVRKTEEGERAVVYAYENGAWRHCDLGFLPPKPGLMQGQFVGASQFHAETAYLSVFRYEPFAKRNRYEGVMKTEDGGRSWRWAMACTEEFPENLQQGWLDLHYGIEWAEPPIGICAAPHNPDVAVYTTLGSSHRTDDGGQYWKCLYCALDAKGGSMTRGLDVTTCYGYHVNPFDKNERMISYTDIGCQRSEDGGNAWYPAMKGIPREWINTCYWAEYDAKTPGRVYGCWASKHDLPLNKMFSHGNYFKDNYGGMAVSEDGGRTWRPTLRGLATTSFCVDPRSPAGARVLYAAMCGTGVYKSVDSGETWAPCSAGLPETPLAFKVGIGGNGRLYLCTVRAKGPEIARAGKFYVSVDGAASWREVPLPEGAVGPCDIAPDPEAADGVYLCVRPANSQGEGAGGIYYSSDAGEHFARLPLKEEFVQCVSPDPAHPGRVFVSTFVNSLYRSDDRGRTWARVSGFNFRAAFRVTPDPDDPEKIYVACFGSSVWNGPAMGNGMAYEDVIV